ncbi:hypothetical protein [Levilactobacillus brevis]|uniref:hypothetical protein n=1 Tax=Levilactobacillus brevis TaxID=1580 RepID=UPI0020CCAB9B|nr:hypothetical protein [Levilactobacillus brevis]MCP9614717.1 hypothetical protein [Levilactobacillus brevis]
MGAILNGKEIHGGFLNGKLLFEELDDNDVLYVCPDNGKNYVDFAGQTFMKFNTETGKANFLTGANCIINTSISTNTNKLAITLPEGFLFGDNSSIKYIPCYDASLTGTNFNVRFDGNKMYVDVPYNYEHALFLSQYVSKGDGLYSFMPTQFYVVKK